MLFKSSYIPLAAAMYFALTGRSGEDYLAATLLFALGLTDRLGECQEEEWQRKRTIEQVRLRIEEEKRHEEEEEEEEED